jgi:hypothetical protein
MIERLYIHCSASAFGSQVLINRWHISRGFRRTGYNYVIGNGFPHDQENYFKFLDGEIETARPDWTMAAAVKGDNRNTAHICLVGMPGEFTIAQIKSAMIVCRHYIREGLDIYNVLGHYEYWVRKQEKPHKSCPGINMDKFRHDLAAFIRGGKTKAQTPIMISTKRPWWEVGRA